MIHLDYPAPDFKITTSAGREFIFDIIRKKNVALSPEEWVRQNIIHYLIKIKNYPSSLMAVEKQIFLGSLQKRCDIVVYNREGKAWMIIECKEMKVPVSQKTLDQLLRYNIAVPVDYLVLTNGNTTYCVYRSENDWQFLEALPDFPQ